MFKVILDPGHGGKDSGATNGSYYEKNFNLTIAGETARYINERYNAAVYLTRISDIAMELSDRADYANDLNADYFVSLHINAGQGTGFESYIYTSASTSSRNYRDILHNHVAGFLKTKDFKDRGKKTANFAVLRETAMPAVLLENLFIDTNKDFAFLKNYALLKKLGETIGEGIARVLKLKTKASGSVTTPVRVPTAASPAKARQLLKSRNPAAPDYVDIYVKMGDIYRIRWDAVFAQSLKETAYWKFGGDVRPEQNNFAGLGAINGQEGAAFATPEAGIEDQFQHWHAYYYGNKLPTGRPELDPRRNAVLSGGWGGALHVVEDLGGKWAPSSDYGISLIKDYLAKFEDEVTTTPDPPSNGGWDPQKEIDRLKKDGLITSDHIPNTPVTWGEFAAVINRLRDRLASGTGNS